MPETIPHNPSEYKHKHIRIYQHILSNDKSSGGMKLDEKTNELIAVGATITANNQSPWSIT